MKFGIVGLGTIVLMLAGMAGGCGEGADLLEGTSTEKPTVVSSRATTVDGNVPLDARIEVTFDKAMNRNSITANSDSSSCIGTHTFLLSDDDFETCELMAGDPDVSNNYRTFTATPKDNLEAQSLYTVKITENALSHDGIALDAPYTATFTTRPKTRVVKLEPTGSGASILSAFRATFEREIDPETIKANTKEGSCDESATFLVSTDRSFSSGCIAMDASVDADAANRVFTARQANPPLEGSTDYWIKITKNVKDKEGVSIVDAEAAFTTHPLNRVVRLEPSGSDKSTLSAFSATFEREIDPTTIKANTNEGSCDKDATFLVSTDRSFSSGCIAMDASVDADAANRVFTARQANPPLKTSTDYWIKITDNGKDKEGAPIIGTIPSTFKTSENDIFRSVVPADLSQEVPLDTNITITSKVPLNPNSVTGNYQNTRCWYALQISHDDFKTNTCVKMTERMADATNGNKTFTLDPAENLQIGKNYKIRLVPGIKDASGNLIVAETLPIGSFDTMTWPTVSLTKPDSYPGAQPVIELTFDRPMDPTTVTINTRTTSCYNSVQVYDKLTGGKDKDYDSCIIMSTSQNRPNYQADVYNGNKTFRFWPKNQLQPNRKYEIQLWNTIKDSSKFKIGLRQDTYLSFHTDRRANFKSWLSPNPTTDLRYRPAIKVQFDRAIIASTVTTNPFRWDHSCGSSFQIVEDELNTPWASDICIPTGGVHVSEDKTTFTIVPYMDLDPSTDHLARVTSAIKDINGFKIKEIELKFSTQRVAAFGWRLPDTFVTTQYAAGDDGSYSRYPPSISNDKAMSIVIDNNTGLIWQYRDQWKHSPYSTAKNVCQALRTTNKSDWRLPTAGELLQMFSFGVHEAKRVIPDSKPSAPLWSSTLDSTKTKNASVRLNANDPAFLKFWDIDRLEGDYSRYGHYVCVRRKTPSGTLEASGDTVYDNRTDLTWQKSDSGRTMPGLKALEFCNDATTDRFTDWRLPNPIELETIIKYDATGDSPFIDSKFDDRRKETYWSSTFWEYEKKAKSMVAVSFDKPEIIAHYIQNDDYPNKVRNFYARCVRSGR